MKTLGAIGAVALSVGALAGCQGGAVEYSKTLEPCSPEYTAPTAYGRFTAQQAARGKPIAWGAYPNAKYQGTRYVVTIYAGGVKVDHQDQSYAPHGSLGAKKALKYTGKKFQLVGNVHNHGKLVLRFELQCKIA